MSAQQTGASRAETVAVIGAGTAGRAFALRCVQAGLRVVLEDVMPSKLRRAQDDYAGLDASEHGAIRYVSTVEEAVADADIAVDFVPDELESKLEIFSLLDRMAPPRTVLCTPTQNLSISDLASCTYRPDKCAAVRWPDQSTAELIASSALHPSAQALLVDLFERMGFSTRVFPDSLDPMLTQRPQLS